MKKQSVQSKHKERYSTHEILSHEVLDKETERKLFDGISARMKAVRKELKITQREFGETAGIDRRYIAKIECRSQNPSFKVIRYLSIKYKISVDWLAYGIGDKLIDIEPEKNAERLTLFKKMLDRANQDEIDIVTQMIKKIMK